jgi:CBS-domain-containing membrane protein
MDSKNMHTGLFMDMVQQPLWDLTDELKTGGVITFHKQTPADEALRTLVDNGILSAPVVDEWGKFMGMIDHMAIMAYSLDIFNQVYRPSRWSDEYLAKKRQFRNTTVWDIMFRCSGDPTNASVLEDFSLFHALEVMTVTGAHRLAVVDSENFVTGLITQSSICTWLLRNVDKMSREMRNEKAFNIRPWNIVATMPVTRRAVHAFKLMKDENLTSVGIVDDNFRLVDVLSTRDLRGINPDSLTFRFLWNTIDFFKDQVRDRSPSVPARPVTVSANSTLEQILRAYQSNKIHRVFVLSESDRQPIDVISQTDILRYVVDTIKED